MERSFGLGKPNIVVAAALVLGLAFLVLSGQGEPASASSGGLGIASSKPTAKKKRSKVKHRSNARVKGTRFGARTLRVGMAGPDVKVLKGIVRSKRLLRGSLAGAFDRRTKRAVRRFQNKSDMRSNGVVTRSTAKALVRSLRTGHASWYGPGLYGNGTACGKVTLRRSTIGLAHKTLPCGTRVLIGFRGKYVIAPVIDRGPYIAGRTWDLTAAAAKAVGLTSAGVGNVRHAILRRGR